MDIEFTPEQQKYIDELVAKKNAEVAKATKKRYANKTTETETQALEKVSELENQMKEMLAQQEHAHKINNLTPKVKEAFLKQGGKESSVANFLKQHTSNLLDMEPEKVKDYIKAEKSKVENVDIFANVKVEANKVIEEKEDKENKTRFYPGTSIIKR